jgi:hypothetical protein
MKKFMFLCVFLFSVLTAHAQLAVAAAATDTLLVWSGLEQIIHYADTIKEWVETANRLKQQIDHWKFQVDGYLQNIKSAKDIRSYQDFMNWYNKQLSIEKRAVESIEKANIKIGNKNYSLRDLEGIADAVDDRMSNTGKMNLLKNSVRRCGSTWGLPPPITPM